MQSCQRRGRWRFNLARARHLPRRVTHTTSSFATQVASSRLRVFSLRRALEIAAPGLVFPAARPGEGRSAPTRLPAAAPSHLLTSKVVALRHPAPQPRPNECRHRPDQLQPHAKENHGRRGGGRVPGHPFRGDRPYLREHVGRPHLPSLLLRRSATRGWLIPRHRLRLFPIVVLHDDVTLGDGDERSRRGWRRVLHHLASARAQTRRRRGDDRTSSAFRSSPSWRCWARWR